jgi:hypothetical protein
VVRSHEIYLLGKTKKPAVRQVFCSVLQPEVKEGWIVRGVVGKLKFVHGIPNFHQALAVIVLLPHRICDFILEIMVVRFHRHLVQHLRPNFLGNVHPKLVVGSFVLQDFNICKGWKAIFQILEMVLDATTDLNALNIGLGAGAAEKPIFCKNPHFSVIPSQQLADAVDFLIRTLSDPLSVDVHPVSPVEVNFSFHMEGIEVGAGIRAGYQGSLPLAGFFTLTEAGVRSNTAEKAKAQTFSAGVITRHPSHQPR